MLIVCGSRISCEEQRGAKRARSEADLEGVKLLPWEAPRHHLPHNDAKRVHIGSLAVVMVLHYLHHINRLLPEATGCNVAFA